MRVTAIGQGGRIGAVPAIAVQPGATLCRHRNGGCGGRRVLFRRQRADRGGRDDPVIDADVVDVGPAHEVIPALDLMRGQDAARQPELVEPRIEIGDLVLARHLDPVDEQPHAQRLVPGEGDVAPLIGGRQRVDPPRHPDARQIGIGDEGIEAMAVPVDAQERHVPAAVIGEPGAEDHERRFPHRGAGPPEERQCPARRQHVARRLPGDIAAVAPARRTADRPIGNDGDVAAEIGDRGAARDLRRRIGVETGVEQQMVVALLRPGRGGGRQGGDDRQRGNQAAHGRSFDDDGAGAQTVTRSSRGLSRWTARSARKYALAQIANSVE